MEYRDIDLTGTEGLIFFRYWDTFHGVGLPDLLKRLRLDPEGSPVDLQQGVTVYLDDDEVPLPDSSTIDGIDDLLGCTPEDGPLISADNGDIASSDARLKGGWLIDLFYEVRHEATYVGVDVDARALALGWLSDRVVEWDAAEQEEFNVYSDYLDGKYPADIILLQSLADLDVTVTLNGMSIAPSAKTTEP